MQCNKVNAVLRMQPHHIDEILRRQGIEVSLIMDHGIIHRYGPDHRRALVRQLRSEGLRVSMA